MTVVTTYDAPIGNYYLVGDDRALVGVWLEGQRRFPVELFSDSTEFGETEVLRQAKDWLDRYFAGEQPSPKEISLSPEGSPFRQLVWKALLDIPYGCVTTYGALAQQLGKELGQERLSAQAVGGAVGHNPISILIPCHRVVGTKGDLTGYAGGIPVKQWLLTHEGVYLDRKGRFCGMEGR